MARFLVLLWLALIGFAAPALAQDAPSTADISAQTPDDPGFLTRFLQNNLSGAGREVRITGFRGALSSRATFDQITIADDKGIWLTLQNGAIQWNRSALLARRIDIDELSAERIILPRLSAAGDPAPRAEARTFSLPELPVSIDIKRIQAGRVEIGEEVAGVAATVSVDGALSLAGGDGEAKLSVQRVDGPKGVFAIDAGFNNATRNLRVDVTLDEAPDGILANIINLEGKPAVNATIKGEGPLQEFAADVSLGTDGQPRVTGRVAAARKAGEDGSPGTGFTLRLGGDVAALLPAGQRAFFGNSAQLLAEGWRGEDGRISLPVLLVDTEALNLSGALTTNAQGAPASATLLLTLGEDAGATSLPVKLPLSGEPTTVRTGRLQFGYDAAKGDGWTLQGNLGAFTQAGLSIESVALDGEGRVALENGAMKQVTGAVRVAVSGLAPDDVGLAKALGDALAASTQFDWTPNNAVDLTGLTVTGTDYDLSGDLRADGLGSGITISGQLDGRYADLSRLATLTGQPVKGRADVSVLGFYTVLGSAFDGEVTLTGTDLAVGQPQADRLLAGGSTIKVSARRDETGIEIYDATVNAARLTAQAAGTINSTGSDLKATLALGSLADVDPALAGALNAEAAVSGPAGDRKLTLTGKSVDLLTGVAQLDAALKGQTDIGATASESGGQWRIDSFTLTNPQLAAEGAGNITPGAMDTSLRFTVPAIGALQPGWAGSLKGEGRVNDTPDGRRLTLTGSADGLRFGQADVDGALSGTTQFEIAGLQKDRTLTLDRARITNDQARIEASGVIAPTGTDLTGTAEIKALESLGRGWKGALALAGKVSDDGSGTRRFDLTGTGENLRLGQAQADAALTGTTRIALRGTQSAAGLTLEEGRIVNDQAQIEAQGSIVEGKTDFTGTAKVASLESLGLGWRGSVDLDGSFRDAGDGARRLTVAGTGQNLALGQAQADAALRGTTRIDLRAVERGGVFTIEAAEVTNPQARVTASGTVGAGQTDLRGQVRADSLAFVGNGVRGALTADARVRQGNGGFEVQATGEARGLGVGNAQADALLAGATRFAVDAAQSGGDIVVRQLQASNPQLRLNADGSLSSGIRLDARLADVALLAPGFSGPATAAGTVRRQGERVGVDLSLTGPGGTTATLAGTAAQDFSTVDLTARGRTDAAVANPFLRVRSIQGPVDFDLRMSGPPTLQSLRGRVSLPSARFSDPKLGVRIDDLRLTADLEGDAVRIDGGGALTDGGSIAVNGRVGLAGGMPLDLRVRLQDAVMRDPNLYQTSITGDLSVTGDPAAGPLIEGELRLGRTEIRIPSTGLGGAKDIPKIIHLNERPPSRSTRAKAGLTPFPGVEATEAGITSPPATPPAVPARLNLTLSAPQQVFIRGRGVDAEMGGQIRLTGTARNIVPIGTLALIRGRVDLLGKRFVLTEGLLELQGSMIPIIRLVAQTSQDGIVTAITIDGEARDPKITFSSIPEMPQEEVLSQLLFRRGLENISALQAVQLANAVAVLAGRGGEGIVAQLRSQVGLDDLDVGTDDKGNVTVRAGKYLSEKVYTDVEVGGDGKSRINLNLDITDALRAKGSVNNEGNSSLGLFYEKDY